MVIIWGKKVSRAKQGVIGRFCPICRAVTVHEVTAIWLVPHLYYVPVGSGEVQTIECACRGCKMMFFDPEAQSWMPMRPQDSPAVAPEATEETVCDLAIATRAEDPEELLARLELEDRQRTGQVTEDERRRLVIEPMAAAAYMAFAKPERSGQQSVTAVLQLLLIIGLVATAILWGTLYQQRTPRTQADYGWCIMVSVVTCVLGFIVVKRMLRATAMGVRAYVLGPVCRSLATLNPPPGIEELEAALAFLRAHEHPLAKSVTGEEILRGMEKSGRGGR